MAQGTIDEQVRTHLRRGATDDAIALWRQAHDLDLSTAASQVRARFGGAADDMLEENAARFNQASARFAEGGGATTDYAEGQLWLGRTLNDGEAVGFSDDRHVVTIAGSRGGKGTSAIVPNLCDYPGSIICIDPKGENASITAHRRGTGSAYCHGLGQKVVVLDPFGIAKVDAAVLGTFNPLDGLDPNDIDALDQANAIAETLIVEKDPKDAHWNEYGKQVLATLILFAKAYCLPHEQNLGFVRDLLTRGFPISPEELAAAQGPDAPVPAQGAFTGFDTVLKCMAGSGSGPVAALAATLQSMPNDERGSVLSNARRNTSFLDSPRMRNTLASSSFQLEELKTNAGGLSLYLCLPVKELANHGRWLRLLVMLGLDRIERLGQRPTASGHPVLFVLDEFPSLGHMRSLEVAIGFIAGYGIKLWTILQDLAQLQGLYKTTWATFLANAGVVQCFANTDPPTLEYLSKRLGDVEVRQRTRSESTTRSTSQSSSQNQSRSSSTSESRSIDKGVTREPRGLIFRGKKTGESANKGVSHTADSGTTYGSSSEVSETVGQDTGFSESISVAPLMRPDEIERRFSRNSGEQLVIISGDYPVILRRVQYFDDPYFEAKFDPSPSHPALAPPTLAERAQWAREEEARRQQQLLQDQQREQIGTAIALTKARKRIVIERWGWGIAAFVGCVLVIRFLSKDTTRPPDGGPGIAKQVTPAPNPAPTGQASLARPAPAPGTGTAPSPTQNQIAVATIAANLRADPSLSKNVIAELSRGELLDVLGRVEGFIQVRDGSGRTGWIADRVAIRAVSLERLRGQTLQAYLASQSEQARVKEMQRQLAPLTPLIDEARDRMRAQDASAFDLLERANSQRSVKIDSDLDAATWYGADAVNSARAKDFAVAADQNFAALLADPSNPDYWFGWGIASYRLGRHKNAADAAGILSRLAPTSTNAWYLLGLAEAADHPEDALAALQAAVRLSKNAATTRKVFADTAAEASDLRVKNVLRMALQQSP